MNLKTNARNISYMAFFAALTCVMSYVTIPLPIIPITGQTLAVMLTGCVLKPWQSALSILIFLLLGAIGIPVFSGGAAGIGIIVGKTGGYLIGFLLGAPLIYFLKGKKNNIPLLLLASVIGGMLVPYTFGVPWLSYITGMSLQKALLLGALPFIPGDLIKAFIAATVSYRLNRYLQE